MKTIERKFNKIENKNTLSSNVVASINDPMYTSFTDLGMQDNSLIIDKGLRDRLLDSNSNWKARTEAIDEVLLVISDKTRDDPSLVQ
jgi:hypothetical protein